MRRYTNFTIRCHVQHFRDYSGLATQHGWMILVFRNRITGGSFGGRRLVEKPRAALLYAQQFLGESREVARCSAISLTNHKAIRYLST